jgi:hypothetical protein
MSDEKTPWEQKEETDGSDPGKLFKQYMDTVKQAMPQPMSAEHKAAHRLIGDIQWKSNAAVRIAEALLGAGRDSSGVPAVACGIADSIYSRYEPELKEAYRILESQCNGTNHLQIEE